MTEPVICVERKNFPRAMGEKYNVWTRKEKLSAVSLVNVSGVNWGITRPRVFLFFDGRVLHWFGVYWKYHKNKIITYESRDKNLRILRDKINKKRVEMVYSVLSYIT